MRRNAFLQTVVVVDDPARPRNRRRGIARGHPRVGVEDNSLLVPNPDPNPIGSSAVLALMTIDRADREGGQPASVDPAAPGQLGPVSLDIELADLG